MAVTGTHAREIDMSRPILAAAALLIGLAASYPSQAGDFSQYLDLGDADIDEIASSVPGVGRGGELKNLMGMIENGDEDDLEAVRDMLSRTPGLKRALPRQTSTPRQTPSQKQSIVASTKTVKPSSKTTSPGTTASADENSTASPPASNAKSVSCTKFIPAAGMTIAIDCE
jgi:hypothetical protein